MSDPWEVELKERFAQLRADEASRAPEFSAFYQTVVEKSEESPPSVHALPVRRRMARWAAVGTTLAAAAVAGILLSSDPDADFDALVTSFSADFGGARWQAPTDGLLAGPGMDLLRTVPSIGGGIPSIPRRTTDPRGNDV